MSLTRTSADLCSIQQAVADSQSVYNYQLSSLPYSRSEPNSQVAGVMVDRLGNAQTQVDVESLLRNQNFTASSCIAARMEQSAALNSYTRGTPTGPIDSGLAPRVQYNSRACMQTPTLDRLDPGIYQGRGVGYGYGFMPENTVNAYKDSIAQTRPPQ